MKNNVVALCAGLIFSLGLGISGMTQPTKVVGFLDIFGNWDMSLAFVMIGAIAVHGVSYRLIRRRKTPLFATEFHVPTSREINTPLIVGAFIFGAGWALAGFCPGPALTSLASFELRPLLFIISMLVGMFAYRQAQQKKQGHKLQ